MDWANQHYGSTQNTQPSRAVIRTKDPGNPLLVSYLKEHNLTTDADKTRFSKYRQIVNAIVNISWITGAVMLLFALLIFTLFIQLTIASCKDEIQLLVTLGASPKQLKLFLLNQFFPSNIIIVLIALISVAALQYILHGFLLQQNIFVSSYISAYTVLTALLVIAVLWVTNNRTISTYISLHNK